MWLTLQKSNNMYPYPARGMPSTGRKQARSSLFQVFRSCELGALADSWKPSSRRGRDPSDPTPDAIDQSKANLNGLDSLLPRAVRGFLLHRARFSVAKLRLQARCSDESFARYCRVRVCPFYFRNNGSKPESNQCATAKNAMANCCVAISKQKTGGVPPVVSNLPSDRKFSIVPTKASPAGCVKLSIYDALSRIKG